MTEGPKKEETSDQISPDAETPTSEPPVEAAAVDPAPEGVEEAADDTEGAESPWSSEEKRLFFSIHRKSRL